MIALCGERREKKEGGGNGKADGDPLGTVREGVDGVGHVDIEAQEGDVRQDKKLE